MIHVCGTDTDVGKTWMTCRLLEASAAREVDARACKPVHSGWPPQDALGPDLLAYGPQVHPDATRYRFEAAMSPHRAAHLEGKVIDRKELFRWRSSIATHQRVWVEGIGGVCCPLAPHFTYLDFLQDCGDPVLVVSRVGLGSLNHALQSILALESRSIPVLGLVLNEEMDFPPDDPIASSARWELEAQVDTPILGPLLWNRPEEHVRRLADWEPLWS